MKFAVYILKSQQTGKFYIGQTGDIQQRLISHNRGDSFSTRNGRPWVLVYEEEYPSRSEAMKREKYLKSIQGWNELKRIKSKLES